MPFLAIMQTSPFVQDVIQTFFSCRWFNIRCSHYFQLRKFLTLTQCQEAQSQRWVWNLRGCLAVRTCHNPFRQGYRPPIYRPHTFAAWQWSNLQCIIYSLGERFHSLFLCFVSKPILVGLRVFSFVHAHTIFVCYHPSAILATAFTSEYAFGLQAASPHTCSVFMCIWHFGAKVRFFIEKRCDFHKKSHITRQTKILHGCHHVANVFKKAPTVTLSRMDCVVYMIKIVNKSAETQNIY